MARLMLNDTLGSTEYTDVRYMLQFSVLASDAIFTLGI